MKLPLRFESDGHAYLNTHDGFKIRANMNTPSPEFLQTETVVRIGQYTITRNGADLRIRTDNGDVLKLELDT